MACSIARACASSPGICASVEATSVFLLIDIQLGDEAGTGAGGGERKNILLALRFRAQGRDARLGCAQDEVVDGDLRGQRHLAVMHLPERGLGIGLRRLDAASHAAENIHLPGRVETDGIELQIQRPVRRRRARRPAAGSAQFGERTGIGVDMRREPVGIHLWQPRRTGHDLLLSRLANARCRRQQIEIGL